MIRNLATVSLILFGISVLFLIAWTASESIFVGMSNIAERIITFSMLVLPAGIGGVLGILSLVHKEGRRSLAITGIILNSIFALFHLMIVLFAG